MGRQESPARFLRRALTVDRGELQMMRIDATFVAAWPEAPVTRPALLG
ncbi:MAG TPA: hypothetical protein VGD76_18775 [Ramlibacter sp.]